MDISSGDQEELTGIVESETQEEIEESETEFEDITDSVEVWRMERTKSKRKRLIYYSGIKQSGLCPEKQILKKRI